MVFTENLVKILNTIYSFYMAISASRSDILSKMGVPFFNPSPSVFAAWYFLFEVRMKAVNNDSLLEGIIAMSILEMELKARFAL